MLAGRRLFMGESDFQTVKAVQQANIPSLKKINTAVHDDLEQIINKSLARDKATRHATAEALAEDLAHFLSTHQMAITSFDIAKIVREVVEERKAQAKKEGKRDGSIIDKLIQEELVRFTSLDDAGGGQAAAEDAGAKPLTDDFSKPLSGEDFVNPSSWASDVLGDDFNPGEKGTSGWREKGLDSLEGASAGSLADMLEKDDDLSPPQSPPNTFTADDEPVAVSKPPSAAETKPAMPPATASKSLSPPSSATSPAPAKGGSGGMIAAIAFVAIAGVGAALWFLKIIPH
jgi:serine/threonine-protein kinase